ncbi:MAG: hypothetical protein ACI3Z7_08325 [Candidatus Aphodosoma sp.]
MWWRFRMGKQACFQRANIRYHYPRNTRKSHSRAACMKHSTEMDKPQQARLLLYYLKERIFSTKVFHGITCH